MDLSTFFFCPTWITISIILSIIALIVLGYFYDEQVDGDGFIVIKALLAIAASIFWPLCLAFATFAAIVAAPIFLGIFLGKRIQRIKEKIKEKKREKETFIKKLDEYSSK